MVKRSSQPTIKEDINYNSKLSPTIAGQNASSYVGARASYVGRDYSRENSLRYLAQSLSTFDRTLVPYLERRRDENIEKSVAEGEMIFANNEANNPNMLQWKGFIEQNPEYTNKNPWLQKGYEQARLKALGVSAEKSFNEAFIESGLVNEKDQAVVEKFTADWWQTYRAENGLDTYQDPVMLSQTYTPIEFQAKRGVFDKHSRYQEAMHETETVHAFTDLAVKTIDNLTTLEGVDIDTDQGSEAITAQLLSFINEASAKGVRDVTLPNATFDVLETMYAHTDNADYLELAHKINIKGVTLANIPEVAKRLDAIEKQRIAKARADWSFGMQVEAKRREQEEDNLVPMMMEYSKSGNMLTNEDMQKLGIPPRLQGEAMRILGNVYQNQTKQFENSPEGKTAKLRAQTGDIPRDEVIYLATKYGSDDVLKAWQESQEDKVRTTNLNTLGKEVAGYFGVGEGYDVSGDIWDDEAKIDKEATNFFIKGEINKVQELATAHYIAEYNKLKETSPDNQVTQEDALILRNRIQREVINEYLPEFQKNKQKFITENTPQDEFGYSTAPTQGVTFETPSATPQNTVASTLSGTPLPPEFVTYIVQSSQGVFTEDYLSQFSMEDLQKIPSFAPFLQQYSQ